MATPWTTIDSVDADGTILHHREVGNGPPVMLLHGFPQTGDCWGTVAARLSERFRVLAPDLPGFGKSQRASVADPARVAVTLETYLQAVDAPRASVVGHDWGGAMAYRLAGSHAHAVDRLVIVNSPYRTLDLKRAWYMFVLALPVIPEAAFTLSRGRLVDLFLNAASERSEAIDADARAGYRAALSTIERQGAAVGYYRTSIRQQVKKMLGRGGSGPGGSTIERPTLIVWGEQDPALPVALVPGIQRAIPGSTVQILPGIGHFVPEEAPDALADAIDRFLRA